MTCLYVLSVTKVIFNAMRIATSHLLKTPRLNDRLNVMKAKPHNTIGTSHKMHTARKREIIVTGIATVLNYFVVSHNPNVQQICIIVAITTQST